MTTGDPLLQALSAFARTSAKGFEITDVLYDLTERAAEVVAVTSAGVSLIHDGKLRHVTSFDDAAAGIEAAQERAQRGPCVEASQTMAAVTIADVHTEPDRWPEVTRAALAAGIVAIAGIPFSPGDTALGALNLYDSRPRPWSAVDLSRAGVLADMATSYVVNASQVEHERRTNEQLQQALNNRVIIEQAKGILAAHNGVSVNEAFDRIRAHARNHNTTIRSVSEAIVNLDLRV